jgi:hypothetical protein
LFENVVFSSEIYMDPNASISQDPCALMKFKKKRKLRSIKVLLEQLIILNNFIFWSGTYFENNKKYAESQRRNNKCEGVLRY